MAAGRVKQEGLGRRSVWYIISVQQMLAISDKIFIIFCNPAILLLENFLIKLCKNAQRYYLQEYLMQNCHRKKIRKHPNFYHKESVK